MSEELKKVDHTALTVNQIVIILLNILAFVFNLRLLVAAVAIVMLLGTLFGVPGFVYIYRYILRPLKLAKPQILLDNPEPHRFAQGFGGVVMLAGTISLFLGQAILGWGLVWLVIALAVGPGLLAGIIGLPLLLLGGAGLPVLMIAFILLVIGGVISYSLYRQAVASEAA